MVPHVLASLGREHDPRTVRRVVADAGAAGFDNVNVDLIFGAAAESDSTRLIPVTQPIAPPTQRTIRCMIPR